MKPVITRLNVRFGGHQRLGNNNNNDDDDNNNNEFDFI